jgi:uncharacterized protein
VRDRRRARAEPGARPRYNRVFAAFGVWVEVRVLLSVRKLEMDKLRFDVSYPPERLDLSSTEFRQKGELRVSGEAELAAGGEEIRVRGRIGGVLERECDRCLEVTPLPIDGGFELYYRRAAPDNAAEREIDESETEVGYYEGEGVDLADVVTEQVLLWLPMQWICRPDCQGLCPVCGRDRNRAACDCRPGAADDRWAALRGFRPSPPH